VRNGNTILSFKKGDPNMDLRSQRLLVVEKSNDGKEEYFIHNPNETSDP
jgi:hypothetical protein